MTDWTDRHPFTPAVRFDGGDLDCGNGLLLLIRKHIDPLEPGQLLEIQSTDTSVEEDLPAWCRLTKNELVSRVRAGKMRSYLVRKGGSAASLAPFPPGSAGGEGRGDGGQGSRGVQTAFTPGGPQPPPPLTPLPPLRGERGTKPPVPTVAPLPPFAVMGVGSWPRPGWLLRSLHEYLSGRLPEDRFHADADDAVRLAVAAQERAGVDVVTDGEQRRDNYASFVGGRLDNCQLIPITDLLPYVDDPDHFAEELRALDVPADQVRHPAVFGRIGRSKPLAAHELARARTMTTKPVKVALPGPYLLTRTMWLECVSDRAYPDRETLAEDVVGVLREEAEALLAGGARIVQFDEPVLTEVVFSRPTGGRSFMCGALGEKRGADEELALAGRLINAVVAGLPRDRVALHVCRGNWSRDEGMALTGPYTPLVPLFKTVPVGTFFLEMATPRAGELTALRDLPADSRIGLGAVNQKLDRVETVEEIVARAEAAVAIFGPDRVLLNPDCGFATFADNPLASAQVAEAKLAAIVRAARILRERHAPAGLSPLSHDR